MASVNYCFTVCRATDEKVQQEIHPNTPSSADIPTSTSPGVNIFGRFFAFGTSPPISTTQIKNPIKIRAMSFTDIDEDTF